MIFLLLFLTVFISGIAGLYLTRAKKGHIRLLTAFSGAYLLGLSILHLLPEVYSYDSANAGYYILGGFLLQVLLEFFSGGVEHGHTHHGHSHKFPLAMLISLCIHSFVEAMPLASGEAHAGHGHAHLQGPLLTGIILHKIPVALVLVIMLQQSGISRGRIITVLTVFALMAPAGGLFASLAGGTGDAFITASLGIVIGIFLHISTTILFEASDDHRFHLYKMAVIITGLLLSAFLA